MSILIKPIITEKATNDSEVYNRYTFVVDKKANKIEIKVAVEAAYGVTISSVKTLNYPIKRKNLTSTMRNIPNDKLLLTYNCSTIYT